MAKKEPKRLPRGFWDSAEGRILLNKVHRREMTPKELADKVGATEGAVYNAMSKRNMKQTLTPIESDPALDKLLASAEEFIGAAVATRLKALQKEAAENLARAEAAERELERYRNKSDDQEAMLRRFREGVAQRVARESQAAE